MWGFLPGLVVAGRVLLLGEGRRGRTWIHLTAAGKKALYDEISQLKRLIRQVEETPAD
jgi:hypothetical protein